MATYQFHNKGKIRKEGGKIPTDLEKSVGDAIYALQSNPNNKDLGEELKPLFVLSAIQVEVPNSRAAVIVFIPYTSRMAFRKVQTRLGRELEKKFSKTFVFVAQRTILKKPGKDNKRKLQKRPYSRTVTAVHDAILEDLAYPADITGKRVRHKLDQSTVYKVILNKNEQSNFENKTQAFSKIYKKLTGKDAVFVFQ